MTITGVWLLLLVAARVICWAPSPSGHSDRNSNGFATALRQLPKLSATIAFDRNTNNRAAVSVERCPWPRANDGGGGGGGEGGGSLRDGDEWLIITAADLQRGLLLCTYVL